VPQAISADETLTVFENLMIAARLYYIPLSVRKKQL